MDAPQFAEQLRADFVLVSCQFVRLSSQRVELAGPQDSVVGQPKPHNDQDGASAVNAWFFYRDA